jgi:ferrous iron transport protein B
VWCRQPACAIPAIMATRNIENWKERLITILVTPLLHVLRLPVYAIIIALVIPDTVGIFNLQGLTLMLLYLLGLEWQYSFMF